MMNATRLKLPFSPGLFPDLDRRPAYVVGGAVRDLLLGKVPLDYDIAIAGACEAFAHKTASKISGRVVRLGKPGQTIYRVVTPDYTLDITAMAGRRIEEDLRQRDFTINALAYDLKSEQIIDCLSGLRDLENAVIRMVASSGFKKDPVRLIRAYRLASDLGFEIDSATNAQILQDALLISQSAGERIRDELVKIMTLAISFPAIQGMAQSGLLHAVLPELQALKHCRSNRFHAFDAHEHTLSAYAHLENILNHLGAYLPQRSDILQSFPPAGFGPMLKFAVLVHDIGKNRVKSEDAQGRTHYYGHPKQSALMFHAVNRRLRLSNRDADYIEFIVRNHLRPLHFFNAQEVRQLSHPAQQRATARFFMKCGRQTPDLLLHALADMRAKAKTENQRSREFATFVRELIQDYFEQHRPLLMHPPLLTGDDLINTFGLRPSPLFKTILTGLETERLAGSLQSRAEAEKWVESYLKKLKARS